MLLKRTSRIRAVVVMPAVWVILLIGLFISVFPSQADPTIPEPAASRLEAAGPGDASWVVDFGGAPADAPVAGLDQWLARHVHDAVEPAADVLGPKKVMVLRVYFNDYTNTSRYTRAQVEGFFDELDTLWQNTSYSKISIDYQVTDQFQLPDDRSDYIDDGDGPGDGGDGVEGTPCAPNSSGDLSCGDKFTKVLDDAIANSPAGLDWTDLDAVMVVMAETSAAQFHRGQATGSCSLAMGPGGETRNVGCAIFSENPSETDRQVWGRWAHEIGHAFQQGGPAHPSNYNSEFELMDSNYPGQTGVFEKQSHTGFPGWMPGSKYIEVTPESGGETVCLWAMEYDPAGKPNLQAVKAEITGSLYYLISVRRRVLGDDLNGDFASGIPDEGVLIERVSEGSDPWVVVKGKGGDRNSLWKAGDTYDGGTDGIQIMVTQKIDDDNYCVVVRYDKRADQPDVMLYRWTQPPGNTWETTDIWVDSPVNGYGTYRYGSWNDLSGNPVPRGNGDDPAIGQVNRLYARVRNTGTLPATDVEVTWEIIDPPGVGIAGAAGWANIGSVDKNDFPGLASIAPGAFVDVYVDWTPDFEISPEDLAAGRFYFHTCVRVKLNHVAGETVFGNQDGDGEQENIDYFQAVPPEAGESRYEEVIRLRNDDLVNPKFFYLSYEDDLPDGWFLDVNGGDRGVELAPGEVRDIPITIEPVGPAVVGSIFGVDVSASSLRLLVSDLDPEDEHPEFKPLGGVRVEARVLLPPRITCRAESQGPREIFVEGQLEGVEEFYDQRNPFRVMIEGVDGGRRFLPATAWVLTVGSDGSFEGYLNPQAKDEPVEVVCLFAGTTELASASSGYVPIAGLETPTPTATLVTRGRVAYIYNTDTASRDSFNSLLSAAGFVVDLVPLSSAATFDFSADDVIVIGDDTGNLGSWGTPDAVSNVNGAGKPIIGVGEGGYAFLGRLGLATGWPNGAHGSASQIYVVDPTHPIYTSPNPISVPLDRVLSLYTSSVDSVEIYVPGAPPAGVTLIGRLPENQQYYPLIAESAQNRCYRLWGFSGLPATMTGTGKDLFVNILLTDPCGVAPTPTSTTTATPTTSPTPTATRTATPTTPAGECQEIFSPTEIPSPGLIHFDDLPNATVIGASYQASHGVTFEVTDTTRAITYGNEPAEAQSPPNVASNDAVFPNTSTGVPMNISFDGPKTHVGFWMGNGETVAPAGLMTAYDAAGKVICRVQNAPVPEPHTEFIGIHDPAGRIASVALDYGQTGLSESIDDLYFAPYTPPTVRPTRTPLPTWTPIPSATPTPGPTATPTLPILAVPYVPPVLVPVVPVFKPDLSIHGIEITQGIQCFDTSKGLAGCADNSLPVVTKKDATARIYLKYSGVLSSLNNVPVRLHIFANGVEYIANTSGKAVKTLNQANNDDARVYFNVNFTNDVVVDFYAEVDPNNTIAETNEGNNRYPAGSGFITLNFRRRDTLKIVGQRLRYHPSGYAGTQYAGGWAVNGGAADWYEQLLPIRNNGINYSVKSGYLDWTTSVSGGTQAQNAAGQHALIGTLNVRWILENAFGWLFSGAFTGADHVYGWVPNAAWSGGHADMPVYPHAGGLGVVGIGTDAPGTSTDNPGRGAVVFGHELTHDYNVKHTNTADSCGSDDDSSDFPYASSSIQEFGFNPITGKIYNPANTHDLMSYCPPGSKEGWISPFTWNKMFGKLSAALLSGATQADGAGPGLFRATQDTESLVVNATIFNPEVSERTGGELGDLYRVDAGVTYGLPEGDYAVELRRGETVLRRQTFAVSFESEYSAHADEPPGDPSPAPQMDVSFIMPWADGTTSVVLMHQAEVLDTRPVSPNAPQVLITSPTEAVDWPAGSTQTLTWQGSDADGDSLTYSVFYSYDGGANWELLAGELADQSFTLEVDTLAGGSDVRFRVVATDGVNTAYDETDEAITVPDKAPYAIITNPVSGQVFAPGALVVLQGTAGDLEDGGLPDSALQWSSDRQGSLGVGPSVALNTLQPGQHVIALTVADSHGQTTDVSVSIFVGHRVYLPLIRR